MTLLIDTHIHLDHLNDLQSAVAAARAAGVGGFVVPGTSDAAWPRLLAAVNAVPGAFAAPGIHPQHADRWQPGLVTELQRLLEGPRAVAVGEVGLDRHAPGPADRQEEVFRQMIRIARALDKPLLIHQRGATGRLLEILREEHAEQVGGIFHAFSGSVETACQAIDLNFAIGVGGVVTYPEARRLPEVVEQVSGDWLVLETDAPDMAPHPHRDQANRPVYLPLIAARIGALRGWDPAETARKTSANAGRVLRLASIEDFPVTSL